MNPKRANRLTSNPAFYLALLLIAIVVISSWFGVSYYFQILHAKQLSNSGDTSDSGSDSGQVTDHSQSGVVRANVLINYGNGVSNWYNETGFPQGWSFYNLTVLLVNGNLEAYYYPTLKAHFLIGIGEVRNSDPYYWTLWIYCPKYEAWARSWWGADWLILEEGRLLVKLVTGDLIISTGTLSWFFQDTSQEWQPPVAGTQQIAPEQIVTCSS